MEKNNNLCVFVPFFNEEKKSINLFLKNLKNLNKYNFIHEIYLINDGSDDNTLGILKNFLKEQTSDKFKIINNDQNKGVGFSFKKVLNIAQSSHIIFIPSDNDISLDIFENIKAYMDENIDLIMFFPLNLEKYSRSRYLISMLFRIIYGFIFNVKINYIQAPGLYNLKKIKEFYLFSNRFSIWAELNIKLLKSGISFSEVGIEYKKKSFIDRSISLRNFCEVVINFVKIYLEIYLFKKQKYKNSSNRIYLK